MITYVKSIPLIAFAFFTIVTVWPLIFVLAAPVAIDPILIDADAAPRDIITRDISLTNTTAQKIILYATVNEIAIGESGDIKEFVSPVMTDQKKTVTSWIEISRGRIELMAGETKAVPLTLRIHPYAEPGEYHAFVGFVPGPDRPTAEAIAMAGNADGVIVKVALAEKQTAALRISSFLIDRLIFDADQRQIIINLENNGDSATVPTGEIIFYNSRGEEISSVPVNSEAASVAANETLELQAGIPFYDKLGRFKANLRVVYGTDQQASVFDTTQFFMIPYILMLIILTCIVAFSLVITFLIRRAFYDEMHDEEDGTALPLYVRSNRDHETKDHDINLQKK